MKKKTFTHGQLEVKDAEQGLVRAVFATLNVIDKDGDVTLPGAFGDQQVRLSAWGHNWGDLPVGRGAISEEGDSAVFDGRFFLDTDAGREHFRTVKNLGDLQEWSYGFGVRDSGTGEFEGQQVRFLKDLEVFEVSPVMIGAGVSTRTVAMKADDKTAIAPHRTEKAPEDTSWSRPALSDFTEESWEDLSDEEKRRIAQAFVWSAEMPPAAFGDLKGPHHLPDGRVVWRGCAALAARMNQMDIPEGDMAGVMRHLAGHYAQFDREPPWEARSWELVDHGDYVIEEVQAFMERAQSVAGELVKDGRLLSGAKRDRLIRLADLIGSVGDEIQGLLTKTEQPAPEKLLAAFSEFQRIEAAINRLAS